jgi:hypothetical protein
VAQDGSPQLESRIEPATADAEALPLDETTWKWEEDPSTRSNERSGHGIKNGAVSESSFIDS